MLLNASSIQVAIAQVKIAVITQVEINISSLHAKTWESIPNNASTLIVSLTNASTTKHMVNASNEQNKYMLYQYVSTKLFNASSTQLPLTQVIDIVRTQGHYSVGVENTSMIQHK